MTLEEAAKKYAREKCYPNAVELEIEETFKAGAAHAYQEAAKSFEACGETAVALAYMDKAKEAVK